MTQSAWRLDERSQRESYLAMCVHAPSAKRLAQGLDATSRKEGIMPSNAQVIKISSKRQITIPAKLYQALGFEENAVCVPVEGGLLLLPEGSQLSSADRASIERVVASAAHERASKSGGTSTSPSPDERAEEGSLSSVGNGARSDARAQDASARREGFVRPSSCDDAPVRAGERPRLWDEVVDERGHGSAEQRRRKALESDEAFRDAAMALNHAAAEYPAIARVYLFGAIARGAYDDDSPIDARIELRPFTSFGLHDLMEFCRMVDDATARRANVISAPVVTNQELAATIERDKVLVYAHEQR